jgi:uncharacterized membrane protein YgdD (TMEM256/DUF423 family)
MDRLFFSLGSLSAFIAVALCAFAAHGLKSRLEPAVLATFETGVRYHTRWPGSAANASGWLFVAGTVLFSGSLYALSLGGIRWLGAITPFGGAAFLAGWLCLAWAAWKA